MKREKNFDCLRVVLSLLVIMTHVSALYVNDYQKEGGLNFLIGNVYDSISRIAVPLFVMLAGRYALSNSSINSKEYYKKVWDKIYRPTFLWSLFYLSYSYLRLVGMKILNLKNINFFNPIINLLKGEPFYHLWYLYMMVGIYFLVPYIIKLKTRINDKKFFKIGIFFLLISMIIVILLNYNKKNYFINYESISIILEYYSFFNQFKFIEYIGYFILGYSLKNIKVKKIPTIILYFISLMLMIYMVEKTKDLFYYNNNFIFVVISSLSIYLIFNSINIKYNFYYLSKYSFDIYLIHAFVLNIITSINKIIGVKYNPIYYIPITIIIVFLLSLFVSIIIKKIKLKFKEYSIF